jgi:hypothetical protein
MATKQEQKEFALSQLAPYYADPSTCAKLDNSTCLYLTNDGRMCVAGKNMINPQKGVIKPINLILLDNDFKQEGIFKPEVVGILDNEQWGLMQGIHDNIPTNFSKEEKLKVKIDKLNLFTFEELVERAESLKKVEN